MTTYLDQQTDCEEDARIRKDSGEVNINSKLTSFLYELMRDNVPPGELERLVRDSQVESVQYTNGWLAKYAEDLANRLL